MDCMEAKAFNSNGQLSLKSTQLTDFLCAYEDFSVDELLDFSDEEVQDDDNDLVVQQIEKHDNIIVDEFNSSNPLSAVKLSLLDDHLAQLEWVSQFVDESPSELSLLIPVAVSKEHKNRVEPVADSGLTKPLCLPSWAPAKPRSKRPRHSSLFWSIDPPYSSLGVSPDIRVSKISRGAPIHPYPT